MIDAPLATNWRYDLGSRKIFELRSALGLAGEGPAPTGAVFAYGIIPGLARMLTHSQVAAHRDDLRMSRLEVVFASELDMGDRLVNTIEVEVRDSVIGTISSSDGRAARAIATLHLTTDAGYEPSVPLEQARAVGEFRVDRARCFAFAAATWDLNPAYWDPEFAEIAGLGGLVVPPGLPFALAAEMLEQGAGRRPAALDVRFDRAARPGDRLALFATGTDKDLSFEARSEDGIVLSGTVVWSD